ncbi:MAG: GIY-YIG nuclease family protein [Methylococcaceae bacterium]
MEDLWKIYKSVKQRAAKSNDEEQKYLAEMSVQAMKMVRENPSIENAQEFAALEQNYLNHWNTKAYAVSYSMRVINAIRNNNYTDTKPKFNISFLGNHDPEQGFIYVACSDSRPRQVKIGYTTMTIKKRMQKYQVRYGYSIEAVASAWAQYPARIEMEVHKKLKTLRVCGRENGDSNEWFDCDIQLVTAFIEIIAYEKELDISYKTWA